jgi:hypothetical protein
VVPRLLFPMKHYVLHDLSREEYREAVLCDARICSLKEAGECEMES